MIVSQILKAKADVGVIAVKPESSVSEAVAILSEKRIGTLVVSKSAGSLDAFCPSATSCANWAVTAWR